MMPANRRTGRPRWSPPDLKVVEHLAALGLTFDQIATLLGINRATLFRKKKQSKDFCAAVQRGRAKGIVMVTNALYELIERGYLPAIMSFLRKHGFCEKPDSNHCPDGGWSYMEEQWEHQRRLIRYMTPAEYRWFSALIKSWNQRIKAAGRGGRGDAADNQADSGVEDKSEETLKPANRRTGRPRWSPPELNLVQGLAERGLTREQLATSLGIDRVTLYRKMRDCPDFRAAVTRGEAKAKVFVAGKLWDQGIRGNLTACKFYLASKGWSKRRDTDEHHHSELCVPAEEPEEREEWDRQIRLLTEAERFVYVELFERAEQRMTAGGPPGRGRRAAESGPEDESNLRKLIEMAEMGGFFWRNRDQFEPMEDGEPMENANTEL